MTGGTLLYVLVILMGPAVGSFLGVVVDRLPRAGDTVRQPSACRRCGTPLALRQMVPILSYLLSSGRCATCGGAIPPWTLYLELICLVAAVLAVLQGGTGTQVILSAAFLWILAGLATADLLWLRLFDPLTAALALVTYGMAVSGGGAGLSQAMLGSVMGAGAFAMLRWLYWLWRGREGLGLGDVKLMVGLGAFTGPYDLPLLVLLAALSALVVVLGQRLLTQTAHGPDRPLPFGTALCAAGAVLWIIGPQLAPVGW